MRFRNPTAGRANISCDRRDHWRRASDGALHALKGDEMLTVQYKTSGATFDETIELIRAAVERL